MTAAEAAPASGDGDAIPGRLLIRASWAGTVAYGVVAILAVWWLDTLEIAVAVGAGILFFAGSAAFLWAFFVAVERSRTEVIGVGGLYFLAGCAPAPVQRTMMLSLGAQSVVAIGTASARPYTALAFGVLVPMWGLGLAGLWGARHGTFPRRSDKGT